MDEQQISSRVSFDTCTREGMDSLLQGNIESALHRLDAAYYLFPEKRALLWQRGIACYYAGRYEDGAAQFEIDMEENGCEVEEVLWHFMCNCKLWGYSRAKKQGFLRLRGAVTVAPMREVLELFEGGKCVTDVIQAAMPAPGQLTYVESYNGSDALAYANFYSALYYEVTENFSAAMVHLERAAEFQNPDFIGKLMKFHYELYKLKVYFPRLMPRALCGQANHSFSAIIQGGWQLSKGHSTSPAQTPESVVTSLLKAIDCGMTSVDCGDIYTGVELTYGKLLNAHSKRGGKRSDIQIHTKLVPDLQVIHACKVDETYVRSVVSRSLGRLGTSYLDLVQFYWWDRSMPQFLDVVHYLSLLQQEGTVRNIGLTNFDVAQCQQIVATGVEVATVQVQYSLLDQRPSATGLVQYCVEQGIAVLAYGVLAGGFLTDKWLHKPLPSAQSLSNRSLVKYLLIIEEFGGWELFQQLLTVLRQVADKHSPLVVSSSLKVTKVTIAMVAIQYVLSRDGVKAVITPAHNPYYHRELIGACHLKLSTEDLCAIEGVSGGVSGQVFELERCISGRHGKIMKYNLNQLNQESHFEEICERFVDLYLSAHPEEATKLGYRPQVSDHCLTDDFSSYDHFKYSLLGIKSGYDAAVNMDSEEEIFHYTFQMRALLQEVTGINRDVLCEDQLVDLKLMQSRIHLELLLWEELQRYKKDILHYLPVDGILLLLPLWGGTKDDSKASSSQLVHPAVSDTDMMYRSLCLLSRLQAIPKLVMAAEQLVFQPCKEVAETAIRTCEHLEIFLKTDLPKLVSVITDAGILDELVTAAQVAAACVRKFCDYIRRVLLPGSINGSTVGLEAYRKILRYEHFIEDMDGLLAMGEEHFAQLKHELEQLAAEINPGKSWKDITRDVIRLNHPLAEDLLDSYMIEIDKARSQMLAMELISPLPAGEKVVGFYTPEILRPFSPFGDFLNPPSFRTSSTGQLMLHSVHALKLSQVEEERLLLAHDYTWIRVIAPHECYPGHHVQALHIQHNSHILRKCLCSVYFYEGWGLYAEELAYETGFYARELPSYKGDVYSAEQCNKLTRLTQLRLRLWRAARVLLDVKFNSGLMNFEECQKFLETEVMFDPVSSHGEVFMYLTQPGYASCYLAGYVEIMKLRDEAMKKMGDKFSLKVFHDSLLSTGCLPFKLLHTLIHL